MKGIFLSNEDFFIEENYDEYLGSTRVMEIERPIGFKHVTGVIYKLNYGFFPNTIGKDGDETDVYLLDVDEPLQKNLKIKVYIIGAIIRFDECDDIETKYVAVRDKNKRYSIQEIKELTNFMEGQFKSMIVVN